MEAWEEALDEFLDEWKDMDEVAGALVCGSFVTGNPSSHSDIDLHIVLVDGTDWRERGNRIVKGFLIEYFANPPAQIREYFEDDGASDRRMAAVQFTTGRIIFDKDGVVQQLRDEAQGWMDRPFQSPSAASVELSKYSLWDGLDNLQDAFEQRSPSLALQYYHLLMHIYREYAKFVGQPVLSPSQVYKCLTQPKDARRKYLMDPFPDKEFASLFAKGIVETEPARMPEFGEKLTWYVLDKMGGLQIDGWKFRSPAKT